MLAKHVKRCVTIRAATRPLPAFLHGARRAAQGAILLILLFVPWLSGPAPAQAVTHGNVESPTTLDANGATVPDISGMWTLSIDGSMITRARLLPQVTPNDIVTHLRMDVSAIRWCNYLGTPALMQSRFPLDIQQGGKEIVIVASEISTARHIYTDGRGHVDPAQFDPTTNGDSIGHWEGDTLVVDTVGFSPNRGITSIPGGGFKTATSHLVERYRLGENGATLSVTFTWTDPNVFAAPHTYAFRYTRAPRPAWARKVSCDPFDDERTQFLSEVPK